jgi:serine/threonine protein kinase
VLTLIKTDGAATPTDRESQASLIAGRYRVEQTITERSSGVAMKAFDLIGGTAVFLKTFLPDYMPQYRREAAAAMQLNHPNLLRAIDTASGGTDGISWIAYPFVSGTPVRQYVEKRNLGTSSVLRCAAEVLKALVYVHQQGWIHCDIKPDNLICVADGEREQFVLVDLGAATTTREARGGKHVVGSPAYTAPERLYDAFGPQSDLYSVGVLCYELATGHLPFIGTIKEIYQGHLSAQPAFQEIADPDLRLLIESLMEKQPARRMRSAADALAAVLAIENNSQLKQTIEPLATPTRKKSSSSSLNATSLNRIGEFELNHSLRAIAVAAENPVLALIREAHVEFVDFSGRALGPAIISSGPMVADNAGMFLFCAGGNLVRMDASRGFSKTIAAPAAGVRTIHEGFSMLAWCDGRDVSLMDASSATKCFRNRTYAGEPQLAFLDADCLAVSTGSANHSIAYFDLPKSKISAKVAEFSGPIIAITENNAQLLCASLVSHRPGHYDISAISRSGQLRSSEVVVANGAIAAAAGRVYWIGGNGMVMSTDTGLALRSLGRVQGEVMHLSISPDARYLAMTVRTQSGHSVQVMETN